MKTALKIPGKVVLAVILSLPVAIAVALGKIAGKQPAQRRVIAV